jgi:hypothetical protein
MRKEEKPFSLNVFRLLFMENAVVGIMVVPARR